MRVVLLGLDRLQKLIKGLDPDAEEEDEELDEEGPDEEVPAQ